MRNDEAPMVRAGLALNDERMTKQVARISVDGEFRHLLIRHSLALRHSSFVIITL
jgi:hypothetical protein